jgi:large subunit ribosomal protein L22
MADNDKVQFQNLKNRQVKPLKTADSPIAKESKKEIIKPEIESKEEAKKIEEKGEVKKEEKTEKVKKEKKTEAVINGRRVPVSLKHSGAIGKFIKFKKIEEAISNLEKVMKKKLAVPMKGEIAHRKGKRLDGKRMMSGRYPIVASKNFIKLLKTLKGNSIVNGLDLEKTIISEVILNKAPNQMHRFGRTRFKRTHITIKAKEIEKTRKKK